MVEPGGRAVVPAATVVPVRGAAPVVQVLAPGVPARVDAVLTCNHTEGCQRSQIKCLAGLCCNGVTVTKVTEVTAF